MPIYEYQCESCKKTFEVIQRLSDKPLTECVECKGALEKKFAQTAAPQFKGSGFYSTDYKRKT